MSQGTPNGPTGNRSGPREGEENRLTVEQAWDDAHPHRTGQEHFAEAELLLAQARKADADADPRDVALLLRFAQVHATLALTASVLSVGRAFAWDERFGGESR